MDTAEIGMAVVCAGLLTLWLWHEFVDTDHQDIAHKLGFSLDNVGETNLHPEL